MTSFLDPTILSGEALLKMMELCVPSGGFDNSTPTQPGPVLISTYSSYLQTVVSETKWENFLKERTDMLPIRSLRVMLS